MQTEEKYLDVLQNIETTIIRVRQRQPGLLDVEVLEAIEGVLRTYSWEVEKRGIPPMRLTGRSLEVFDKVHTLCEWRLNRATLEESEQAGLLIKKVELRPRDLLPCLLLTLALIGMLRNCPRTSHSPALEGGAKRAKCERNADVGDQRMENPCGCSRRFTNSPYSRACVFTFPGQG